MTDVILDFGIEERCFMASYSLRLLGSPQFSHYEQTAQITLRKAIALVAYLAVEDRSFSREYLATLLWPDLELPRALANLRRVLAHLRKAFSIGCINSRGDQIKLDRAFVSVDIDDFLLLAANDDNGTELENLRTAYTLYRGPFLEGFNLGDCNEFDTWQTTVRQRFESKFDKLLERLVDGCLRAGQIEDASSFAGRWLELDAANEAAHRILIKIHLRAGRTDLARRQYESCVAILADQDMKPDDSTVELFDLITENRHITPLESQPIPAVAPKPQKKSAGRKRRRSRLIAWVGAITILSAAFMSFYSYYGGFGSYDFAVTRVEVRQKENQFEHLIITVSNTGGGRNHAEVSVTFSAYPATGGIREYLVYTGNVKIDGNSSESVYITGPEDIVPFINNHQIPIPPGFYTASVAVTSDVPRPEQSVSDNFRASAEQFFFRGADGVAFIEAEISFGNPKLYNDENPLKVYIHARNTNISVAEWGPFRVTHEGHFYFPLEGVRTDDLEEEGCLLVLVHDRYDNLENMPDDPGDIAALYKISRMRPGSLAYGAFSRENGTPISSGDLVPIDFSPPPRPEPDIFEPDNHPPLAQRIDVRNLPVRQLHTFHDDEKGTMDTDYFALSLVAGESITIETSSSGGLWEAITQVDVLDPEMNYLASGSSSPYEAGYGLMTFTNESGVDGVFYFGIKPKNQYNGAPCGSGEYIVDFRHDSAR